ncbi:MAG: VWA domain-containing protein [Gemmatimonadetes bacterium]|nr:VWA domain-containing protein [Gemmatimonadota bacterium]
MTQIFEFLFKYRPLLFERGQVAFGGPWQIPLAVVALGTLMVALGYRPRPGQGARAGLLGLAGLRLGALAVLAFALARPTLVVPTVVPQQNFLAILVDDSRSMQIVDQGGQARGQVAAQLIAPDGDLLRRLDPQFKVRLYRFSAGAERMGSTAELSFAGGRTRLGAALERVRQDLSGAPLAGIAVFTDGADNAGVATSEAILQLRAARVPVYAVGLGRERLEKDVEVSRLDVPGSALAGSTLIADLLLAQSGYGNTPVAVYVEESGRIVATDTVRLPRDGAATVRIPFTLTGTGPRRIRVRVASPGGEPLVENNAREASVYADDRRHKVLYFEGEPRFETKFIRRAVQDDRQIQLVVLQRTAENKFLRLEVDSPEELVAGFPKAREELFRYVGLVLGSVEASQFTHDQLQMIRDFVGERGGGALLLGGRLAFAEGGYGGTPVADLVPFELPAVEQVSADSTGHLVEFSVDGEPHRLAQGRGDGAAHGAAIRRRSRAAGPGLSAVRPRQGHRARGAGLLAVADARGHLGGRPNPRDPLAAGPALAGERRSGSRDGDVVGRSGGAGRQRRHHRGGERLGVRRRQRRVRRGPRHPPERKRVSGPAGVERAARRRIPRLVRGGRGRPVSGPGGSAPGRAVLGRG